MKSGSSDERQDNIDCREDNTIVATRQSRVIVEQCKQIERKLKSRVGRERILIVTPGAQRIAWAYAPHAVIIFVVVAHYGLTNWKTAMLQ